MSSQGLRLEMWRTALEAARDKPWFGHGVGSYPGLYVAYHGRDPKGASNPHQQYLFWLAEGGVVALGLLLAFFISLLLDARRLDPSARDALVCTTVVAAVMSLANCPFYGVGMGEFFLVMMAALLSTRQASAGTPTPSDREPRRILLIKAHSLGVGDLLRSSAAWRALHNRYPGVQLHLLFLSKHAGYPTEAFIRDHHLLASAHFVTIREGHPGQAKAQRLPLSVITHAVQSVARQVQPDWVIDFESSGMRTSWLTRKAAKVCGARAIGIAQFPGRACFYDLAAPSVPTYKQRHGLPATMDYTDRDFVALSALGIERQGLPIELQLTQDGQAYADQLKPRLPAGVRVIGLNIGCGTPDALGKRPALDVLADAIHELSLLGPAVVLLSGAPFERDVNQAFMATYRQRHGEALGMMDLAGESSLSGLTGLISLCDLFVSTDSGPYHMAVAMRIPTIAWFVLVDPSSFHNESWCRNLIHPQPAQVAQAARELLALPA
jgi:ADP-heptose:LPS heptosyltransferase